MFRVRVKPRRALVAPLGSKGAPVCASVLAMRETMDVSQDGQQFHLIDEWTGSTGHALIEQPWIGEAKRPAFRSVRRRPVRRGRLSPAAHGLMQRACRRDEQESADHVEPPVGWGHRSGGEM